MFLAVGPWLYLQKARDDDSQFLKVLAFLNQRRLVSSSFKQVRIC